MPELGTSWLSTHGTAWRDRSTVEPSGASPIGAGRRAVSGWQEGTIEIETSARWAGGALGGDRAGEMSMNRLCGSLDQCPFSPTVRK